MSQMGEQDAEAKAKAMREALELTAKIQAKTFMNVVADDNPLIATSAVLPYLSLFADELMRLIKEKIQDGMEGGLYGRRN